MADIELVIKIPEEMWKRVKEGYVPLGISKYLRSGTPLPKGHGDLVDRGEVIKSLFDYHNGKKTIGQCIDDVRQLLKQMWGEKMKMKYKVKSPWLVTYGENYMCTIMLKVGQKWNLFTEAKDSVVISRENVSIEIDKEHFEKYFEKIESEDK